MSDNAVEILKKIDANKVKDQAQYSIESGFDSIKDRMGNWADSNKEK